MRAMSEKRADQTTCAAFWVKGIAETLEAAGLDIHALFEEAGLELTSLSDADARFPTGDQPVVATCRDPLGQPGNWAGEFERGETGKLRRGRIRDDVVGKPARHSRAGRSLCRYPQRRGHPHHRRRS